MSIIDAVDAGNLDHIRQILHDEDDAIDPCEKVSALKTAAYDGNLEIVKLLIESGIDMNIDCGGMSALDCAIEGGHIEAVQFLVENGANINVQDEFGQSPLFRSVGNEIEASKYRYDMNDDASGPTSDFTALLLKYGADPNIKTNNGETALDWAIKYGHPEAEKLLREHGALRSSEP